MPRNRRDAFPLVLAACLGCATTGGAGASGEETVGGVFDGDAYRYDRMDAPVRALYDVAAIPAGATSWDSRDWLTLSAWASGIGALMVPAPRSLDVRLDDRFRRDLDARLPTVWTVPMQATLWGGIAAAGLGTWWWSADSGHAGIAQGLSLMGESLAVTQAYHVGIKILLGREGPRADGGEPRVLGPGRNLGNYPAGTPSGHAATLYPLMSAAFAWFDPPGWVQVTGHVLVGGLVTLHAIEHRHYVSDVLWGGAMGWYVGQWVVKHRASRPEDGRPAATPTACAAIVPAPLPGGAGAMLMVTF